MQFTIEDLTATDGARIEGAAALLHAAFSPLGVWTTMAEAREEVVVSISAEKISRVAVGTDGVVLGWIGAMPEYDGLVWQLHPIVVDEAHRRHGIGRALMQDLEAILIARGGLTLWAGSDDLAGETSLGGVDLYPALPAAFNRRHKLGTASAAVLSPPRLSHHRRDAGRERPRPARHLSRQAARRLITRAGGPSPRRPS